jgi:hypothetical protein
VLVRCDREADPIFAVELEVCGDRDPLAVDVLIRKRRQFAYRAASVSTTSEPSRAIRSPRAPLKPIWIASGLAPGAIRNSCSRLRPRP